MGKKLAIKGHSIRGNEVIEILEMMGGKNCYNVIEGWQKQIRAGEYIFDDEGMYFLTLEEFLKKYPFKVGDKVMNCYGDSFTIKSMSWSVDCETMVYDFENTAIVLAAEDIEFVNENKPLFKNGDVVKLKGCPDKNLFWIVMDVLEDGYIFNDGKKYSFNDQHHYEKSSREVINIKPSKMKNVLVELLEHIKTTPKEDLEREFEEIESEGWFQIGPSVEEFIDFCNKINKKPKYPTTYEECCGIIGIPRHEVEIDLPQPYQQKMFNLFKLLICRDAYWKIAGEEMGLGKPWEPDWNDINRKYFISLTCDGIGLYDDFRNPQVLAFPIEEMRDAFYENFKDLIESCKELL